MMRLLLAIPLLSLVVSGLNPRPLNSRGRDKTVSLPEVVVRPKKYSMIHLVCYVREYSSISSDYDTIQLFREKTVDFMVPAHGGKKGGWLRPRVLASRSAYRFANYEGLDSVSDRFNGHFSRSDLISLFRSVDFDSILTNNKMFQVDLLDNSSAGIWMPSTRQLLESPSENFTRFEAVYYLSDLSGKRITPDNLDRFDVDVRSGSGFRSYNKALRTKDPIYMDTHAEFYVIAKEYLNGSEAKRAANNQPSSDEVDILPPDGIPPLPPLYADISHRASLIDHDKIRLEAETDSLLIGPMYNNFMHKNQNIVGRLWDKFKKFPHWLRKHI